MTDQECIGRRIKAARVLAGMSQQELADAVGVSKMAVSKWEHGLVMFNSRHLMELSNALGKPVDYLMWTDVVTKCDVQEEVEAIIADSSDVKEELVRYIWNLVRRLQ